MNNTPYIHLRTHSSYSLAESTLKINKIVELAKKNNMPSVALTDNNNMFGALEFSIECINNGIQPIIGSTINYLDITNSNISSQVTFLVKNENGYKNLLYLSSISHTKRANAIGITFEEIKKNSDGLICFIGGEFNPLLFLKKQNKLSDIDKFISNFINIFYDNFYFEIQRN